MNEFPGRIYVRVGDGSQRAEQQSIIDDWIAHTEKNYLFVFPEKTIQVLSSLFIITGLLLIIFQIILASIQQTFISSLLGSGIWLGLLCIVTGSIGLKAAQRKDSANLMDFMVSGTIVNMFSALVVILNTIGLEMYSKLCYYENAKQWIGECGRGTIALQSALVFLNLFLFVFSSFCGGYLCRVADTSFQCRTPPLVIYYTNTPVEEMAEGDEASEIEKDTTETTKNRGDTRPN